MDGGAGVRTGSRRPGRRRRCALLIAALLATSLLPVTSAPAAPISVADADAPPSVTTVLRCTGPLHVQYPAGVVAPDELRLNQVRDLAVDPVSGAVAVAEATGVVSFEGSGDAAQVRTVAADDASMLDDTGPPATRASLRDVRRIAYAPDGTLYLAAPGHLWEVTRAGDIRSLTDGGGLQAATGIATEVEPTVAADDAWVYVVQDHGAAGYEVWRQARDDGRVERVAGGGTTAVTDGAMATAVKLTSPASLGQLSADGSLLIISGRRVLIRTPDGLLQVRGIVQGEQVYDAVRLTDGDVIAEVVDLQVAAGTSLWRLPADGGVPRPVWGAFQGRYVSPDQGAPASAIGLAPDGASVLAGLDLLDANGVARMDVVQVAGGGRVWSGPAPTLRVEQGDEVGLDVSVTAPPGGPEWVYSLVSRPVSGMAETLTPWGNRLMDSASRVAAGATHTETHYGFDGPPTSATPGSRYVQFPDRRAELVTLVAYPVGSDQVAPPVQVMAITGPASAPAAPVVARLPQVSFGTVTVHYATADPRARYWVGLLATRYDGARFSGGAFNTTARAVTVSGVPPGSVLCASVTAAVGSHYSAATNRCTLIPLDERRMAASAGWSRVSSSAAYLRTQLRTTRIGARLTLRSVRAHQIGLVVPRCSRCGTVEVLLGGVRVGRVSEAGSSVARRVVWLPRSSRLLGGNLVIRSTSRRPVLVDAVLVR